MSLDMEILADQISRAFRGESWHGPSVVPTRKSIRSRISTCGPVTFVLPSADADGLAHVVRACVEGRRRGEGGARIATFTEGQTAGSCHRSGALPGIRYASRRRHDGRSGRAPFVPIMQATDLRDRHDGALGRWRDSTRNRRIFVQ
jgi:hypothetical protein